MLANYHVRAQVVWVHVTESIILNVLEKCWRHIICIIFWIVFCLFFWRHDLFIELHVAADWCAFYILCVRLDFKKVVIAESCLHRFRAALDSYLDVLSSFLSGFLRRILWSGEWLARLRIGFLLFLYFRQFELFWIVYWSQSESLLWVLLFDLDLLNLRDFGRFGDANLVSIWRDAAVVYGHWSWVRLWFWSYRTEIWWSLVLTLWLLEVQLHWIHDGNLLKWVFWALFTACDWSNL